MAYKHTLVSSASTYRSLTVYAFRSYLIIVLCYGIFVSGAGLQWNNFTEPPTVDGNFSMLAVILLLILDTFIYMVIAWYVDAIHPGDFGVPQPFYFPFTVS